MPGALLIYAGDPSGFYVGGIFKWRPSKLLQVKVKTFKSFAREAEKSNIVLYYNAHAPGGHTSLVSDGAMMWGALARSMLGVYDVKNP